MQNGNNKTVNVYVNPLDMSSLSGRFRPKGEQPSADEILRDLASPTADAREEMAARYAEISKLDSHVQFVAYEPQIHSRIVMPLRLAKISYLLGHDVGCIMSAGVVGEMTAVFQYETAPLLCNGKPLSRRLQEAVLGQTFEGLRQSRRVQFLMGLQIWSKEQGDKADKLAKIRNKYLHRFSITEQTIRADALQAYEYAVALASPLIGLIPTHRGLEVAARLESYLAARGCMGVVDADETDSDQI